MRWKGKPLKAHRLAWLIKHGTLPPINSSKDMLCHACNEKGCIRIGEGHVYFGDGFSNAADRIEAGTVAKGATHGSVTKPESIRVGELNGMAKLTDEQAIQIKKTVHAYGKTRGMTAAIARYFQLEVQRGGYYQRRALEAFGRGKLPPYSPASGGGHPKDSDFWGE